MGRPGRYAGFQKQVNQLTLHKAKIKNRFLKRTSRETRLSDQPQPSRACKPVSQVPIDWKNSIPVACPVPVDPQVSIPERVIKKTEVPGLFSRLFNMKPQ